MRQSIYVLTRLPPWLLLAALIGGIGSAAAGQDRYRVTREENFRRDPRPDGALLGRVRAGSGLPGGSTRDGWVEVTLQGWMWAPSLATRTGGEFDREVSPSAGENLRAEPNGAVVARLSRGALVETIDRDGQWVHVRRRGWIWGRSLERVTPPPAASQPAPIPPTTPPVQGSAASLDAYSVTAGRTAIHRSPDGDSAGVIVATTPVRLVERRGDWVRVQLEAWVPEGAIQPTSPDVLVGVSGAELRARPDDFRGKIVQWIVQYISLRTADDLRVELPAGREYMLVRGPIPEAGFAYVLVTAQQSDRIRDLAPLAHLVIDARVVVARSRYLSNTVLELVDFSVRNP